MYLVESNHHQLELHALQKSSIKVKYQKNKDDLSENLNFQRQT